MRIESRASKSAFCEHKAPTPLHIQPGFGIHPRTQVFARLPTSVKRLMKWPICAR